MNLGRTVPFCRQLPVNTPTHRHLELKKYNFLENKIFTTLVQYEATWLWQCSYWSLCALIKITAYVHITHIHQQ